MGRRTSEEAAACEAAAKVCACLNLRKTAGAVTRLYDEALSRAGLRSTQFVILAVLRAREPVALPDLAQFIGLDRSVLTRRLTPLVRDGLVDKEMDAHGGAAQARLTPKGRRTLRSAIPLWQAAQERFESGVGTRRWRGMLADLEAAQRAAGGE